MSLDIPNVKRLNSKTQNYLVDQWHRLTTH